MVNETLALLVEDVAPLPSSLVPGRGGIKVLVKNNLILFNTQLKCIIMQFKIIGTIGELLLNSIWMFTKTLALSDHINNGNYKILCPSTNNNIHIT